MREIIVDEDREALLDQLRRHLSGRGQTLLKQRARAVADHVADILGGYGQAAELSQRVIQRAGEVGGGVGKGAV